MQSKTDRCGYDLPTIWFHWATAILVVSLWIIAQVTDFLPKGPLRHHFWSVHIVLGVLLFFTVAARLFWRTWRGRTLPSGSRPHQWLGKIVHRVLYLLLIAAVMLGIANTWARGWDLFGLCIPQYDPADSHKILAHTINGWHDIAANSIMVIAFLHALTALFDHYALRGDVLGRMNPSV